MTRTLRPINWQSLRRDEAARIVNARAADTQCIVLTDHACQRMEQRGLPYADVLSILRGGSVAFDPKWDNDKKSWVVTMVRQIGAGREAGAVTAILSPPDNRLIVITVEWMDLKR